MTIRDAAVDFGHRQCAPFPTTVALHHFTTPADTCCVATHLFVHDFSHVLIGAHCPPNVTRAHFAFFEEGTVNDFDCVAVIAKL